MGVGQQRQESKPLNSIHKTKNIPWSLQCHQNVISINPRGESFRLVQHQTRAESDNRQGGKVCISFPAAFLQALEVILL